VVIGALGGLAGWALSRGRAGAPEQGPEPRIERIQHVARNPAGDVVLTLDAEAQARMGLRVEALEALTISPEMEGYGRVLDPGLLLSLVEEVTATEAQAALARAEHERAKALYQASKGIAERVVEAAGAELAASEARARAAAGRLVNAWGVGLASLPAAERDAVVGRLIRREAALVRMDVSPGEVIAETPTAAAVVPLAAEGSRVAADRVFEAPSIDERVQGQGFLLYVQSPSAALRPGAVVAAYLQIPGGPEDGVLIPRSAIVRLEGVPWVYVRGSSEKFFRREVDPERLLERGWFVRSGFTPGDSVVVAGAQTLLSEELRYQIRLGED
jgi:hypothetical protein